MHGSTGIQGGSLVSRMIDEGHQVLALTRDPTRSVVPKGAAPVFVDLSDMQSLISAYSSADMVAVHLPRLYDPRQAIAQAERVLEALQRSRVTKAVFNSSIPVPPTPSDCGYIQARYILARSLAQVVEQASIVGPAGPYMENLTQASRVRHLLSQGELAYPLPPYLPLCWVSAQDVTDVMADCLLAERPHQVTWVKGPDLLTGNEIAAMLSPAVQEEVTWRTQTPAEYEAMTAEDFGAEVAAGSREQYERMARSEVPSLMPGHTCIGVTTFHSWASEQPWRSFAEG
ncbi:SDR family oxidoreductase [Streptomyces sp. NPDC085932]|uniref:SDR family oxidoreductase n=1 Tax=Streptomyces sp. NPDC085932 TaxID=3365741 RepID=UPI0037D78476